MSITFIHSAACHLNKKYLDLSDQQSKKYEGD